LRKKYVGSRPETEAAHGVEPADLAGLHMMKQAFEMNFSVSRFPDDGGGGGVIHLSRHDSMRVAGGNTARRSQS